MSHSENRSGSVHQNEAEHTLQTRENQTQMTDTETLMRMPRGRRLQLKPIENDEVGEIAVSRRRKRKLIKKEDENIEENIPGRVNAHVENEACESRDDDGIDAQTPTASTEGPRVDYGGNVKTIDDTIESVEDTVEDENTVSTSEIGDGKDVELMGYEVSDKLSFYEAMKPMVLFMKLFGIWHCDSIEPQFLRNNTSSEKTLWKKLLSFRAYSILVIIVLWVNFLRYIPSFLTGPPQSMREDFLFFKVTYAAFTLQCAANISLMFYGTSVSNRLPRFFHHWEDRVQSSADNKVDLTYVRRRSVIFTGCGLLFICFHLVYRAFGVFGPIESITNSTAVFVAPFPDSIGMQTFILIIDVYECASWVFPICFYVLVCLVLRTQFEKFDKRLDRAIIRACQNGGGLPENFEKLRYQHQELCVAVSNSNHGLLTYTNAVAYSTMLPLACFLLYQLIISNTHNDTIAAQLMYSIWLISIFINVPVVSWIAAVVNTRAHAPQNKTFNIIVKNATDEELLVMKMFTSRLNGTAVGYTIFDLVTLTKPFILTIAGLGVTYFALLAEFD